jgi:hypothetical protein
MLTGNKSLKRFDLRVLWLTVAAILIVARVKKSAEEVASWGPKKQ